MQTKKIFKCEFLLALRSIQDALNPLFFYLIIMSFFPLALGSTLPNFQVFAPGMIWIAVMFALMISLTKIFEEDFADGTLIQMFLGGNFLEILAVKIFCYWLITVLPLLLLTPFISLMFALNLKTFSILELSIGISSQALINIGVMGAALTAGLKQQHILLALIVMPLYVPVLIFSANMVALAQTGLNITGVAALLGSISLAAVLLAPFVCKFALSVTLEA